ncbi:MAG: amino acid adenylation domain-containing protein, partial [bacterium]|nr:amino acid adenylation domain-containing protein [bacterium]
MKSKYTDYRIPLNPEGSRQVVDYCKTAGVSPAIYFKGLYGLILHYYTRPAANFHIRDVASGRTPRYQSTMGPMILVIPTIVDITRINGAGEVSIIEYLQDFRRQKKQLGDNQYISNTLQIQIMGRQELFFDYNFLALNSFKIADDKGIPLEIMEEEENAVIFRIEQTTEGFTLCFHYNEKEFFGERFMERLKHISHQILTGTKTLSELVYHFDNEWELLRQWNDTAVSYPAKTVVGTFDEQVLQSPDAIAVVGQDRKKKGMEHTLTYSRFNRQAHNLAHQLRQKGVGPDTIVGLIIEPTIHLLVGLWGILKAGGAYLPIDPGLPAERLSYILNDSCANIVVTGPGTVKRVEGLTRWQGELITIELSAESTNSTNVSNSTALPYSTNSTNSPNSSNSFNSTNSSGLAYVIYTSGSTGKPKGVAIEHRNLFDYVRTFIDQFQISGRDRVLRLISYTFDASVEEIYPVFCKGGVLVNARNGKDLPQLLDEINRQAITLVSTSPAVVDYFNGFAHRLSGLRLLISGGDELKPASTGSLADTVALYNTYGPTESTVCATYFKVTPGSGTVSRMSIGKPVANRAVYIVDDLKRILPTGLAGEIYLGGAGLARGYLNKPELTAERFVKDSRQLADNHLARNAQYPITNTHLYRTGDLGRWLPDGNVESLGRIDNQVKIRGFRIETGEIENVLLTNKYIEGAVVAKKDGNNYLVAYYVPATGVDKSKTITASLSASELRNFLSEKLPAYMIPTYFVKLEKLPLTPIGKIDRKALPEPGKNERTLNKYQAPTDETEEKLVEMWQEVLGMKKIGITDNFFEIGGHSLKAINLIAKINKTFQVELPLPKLFEKPFIKELAQYISGTAPSIIFAVEAVEKKDYYPLSAAQKRMVALNRFAPDSINYNMPGALLIEGELAATRFEEVFQELIKRHESLRTSFHYKDEEPVQRIHPPSPPLSLHPSFTPSITPFLRPFELSRPPLLRVELVKQEENKHIFLFDMHHIISDGVSMNILVKELSTLYAGLQLKPLNVQYKDYAAWQNRLQESEGMLKQKKYWQEKFPDEIPVLALPTDFPRPAIQDFAGETISFDIDNKLSRQLHELAAHSGATLYMLLLSIYTILLSKYSGQDDIIVGTPSAGRRHADLENIIGMFINTLTMRNFPEPGKTYMHFLRDVKENCLKAFENQDYQFDDLLEHLEIKRDIGRNPLFDTMFSLLNLENEELEIKGLTFKPYEFENKISKFDIALQLHDEESKLVGNLGYCVELFKKETMTTFVSDFVSIARQIVKNPSIKLSEIQVDYESEEKRLLREFNKTDETGPYPEETSFSGDETPRIAAAKELSRRLEIEIDTAIYERVYPMTTLQRDFYIDSLRKPLSCGHRVSAYRLIHAALEPGTWEKAVRLIIRKYPALRTDFLVGNGRFFQGVRKYENKECDFLYVDRTAGMNLYTHSNGDNHQEADTGNPLTFRQEIYDEIKKITLIPHDVTRKPVKFFLIKCAQDLFAVALSVHHAVADGTAGMIIFNELEAYYQKQLKGTPVVIQPDHTYENYVAYHLENFDTGKVKRYWQKKLAAVEPVVKNRSGKLKSKYTDYRIPLNPEG